MHKRLRNGLMRAEIWNSTTLCIKTEQECEWARSGGAIGETHCAMVVATAALLYEGILNSSIPANTDSSTELHGNELDLVKSIHKVEICSDERRFDMDSKKNQHELDRNERNYEFGS